MQNAEMPENNEYLKYLNKLSNEKSKKIFHSNALDIFLTFLLFNFQTFIHNFFFIDFLYKFFRIDFYLKCYL